MSTQTLNGFTGGLDKDTDKSLIAKDSYLHADNFRLVTEEGSSTGALTTIKGNLSFLHAHLPVDQQIIGHTFIRDTLVVFTNGPLDTDSIWKITLNTDGEVPAVASAIEVAERPDFNFSLNNPIVAIGRYETEHIQKIYWTDGVTPIRMLNIADILPDGTVNDITYINNIPIDLLELTPNSQLNTMQLINVVAGSLNSGSIQYAYQLFVRNGAETTFSPLTPLYHLSEDSDFQVNNKTYGGSPQFDEDGNAVNTGKGLELEIRNLDDRFNRVRIVSIHYGQLYSIPEINIVYEGAFFENDDPLDNLQTLKFIDTGSVSLGTYTIEELSMLGMLNFTAETMEVKDNRLFIGNVTEDYFEVTDQEFDARAYRFRSDGQCSVWDEVPAEGVSWWDAAYINVLPSTWNVPFDYNAINPRNFLNNDLIASLQFKYKSDLFTLGGEGPYIDYNFKLKPILIDSVYNQFHFEVPQLQDTFVVGLDSHVTKGFPDYSSPFKSGLIRSYQRDEVYRFGIVLFDKKMRPSPVKWIGDIRMPAISEISNEATYSLEAEGVEESMVRYAYQTSSNLLATDVAYGVRLQSSLETVDYTKSGPTTSGKWEDVWLNDGTTTGLVDFINGAGKYLATYNGDTVSIEQNPDYWGTTYGTMEEFEILALENGVYVAAPNGWVSSYIYSPYVPGGGTTSKYDFNIAFNTPSPNYNTYANVLYLEFDVTIPDSVQEKIAGYQIVRCKREAEDRSVIAQGLVSSPGTAVDSIYYSQLDVTDASLYNTGAGDWDIAREIVELISPEVVFNKNISQLTNDFIRIESVFSDKLTDTTAYTEHKNQYMQIIKTAGSVVTNSSGTKLFTNPIDVEIDSLDLLGTVSYDSQPYTIKNIPFRNVAKHRTFNDYGHRNTNLVLGLNSELIVTADQLTRTGSEALLLATYRRHAIPYGGYTYEARSNNSYIAASHFIPVSAITETLTVFGGDTFIGMFDCLRATYDPIVPNYTWHQTLMFPVESSINLKLRHDNNINKLSSADKYRRYMQEDRDIGIAYGELTTDWDYPDQYTDYYLYNSVYSRDNDAKLFYAEPFDFQRTQEFDTRVYNSQAKISGEYSDSWTKFFPNDYIDLDSQYGELVRIINYRDRLMFFQEKGFGTLSVNYQSVLQDAGSINLVLGSGGILDRADYISVKTGSKHYTSIISTAYGLLWFDALNKKMYKLGQMDEPLSDVKGMNSYFQNNIYGTILNTNDHTSGGSYVWLGYDDKFMQIFCTFYMADHPVDSFTLGYNLKMDNFTSFYSFIPKLYIDFNKLMFTTDNLNNLFLHNYGEYGNFYNTLNPSDIKLIINENYPYTKVFDSIQFISESRSETSNIYNDTFNTIRCYNDYQNSGFIDLIYKDNIERRERSWSLHVPRNAVNISIENNPDILDPLSLDSSRQFKSRLRDKYMIVDLTYNNTNNYKFTISGVAAKYRLSIR